MSVIAKLVVRNARAFGTGSFVELGCLCENDLMAGYAEDEQDKLFTKYSPWGEMFVNQAAGAFPLGVEPGRGANVSGGPTMPAYYVMLLADDEAPVRHDDKHDLDYVQFEGATAYGRVHCFSRTEFGHDSVNVEFRDYGKRRTGDDAPEGSFGIQRLNWRMSVDNPPASDQLRPGREYWAVFYPAAEFDRNAAIRAAHTGKVDRVAA